MTTDAEERKRIRHQVEIMRRSLDALDIALAQEGVPIGSDVAQNIAASAVTVAITIARADAYQRAARRTYPTPVIIARVGESLSLEPQVERALGPRERSEEK